MCDNKRLCLVHLAALSCYTCFPFHYGGANVAIIRQAEIFYAAPHKTHTDWRWSILVSFPKTACPCCCWGRGGARQMLLSCLRSVIKVWLICCTRQHGAASKACKWCHRRPPSHLEDGYWHLINHLLTKKNHPPGKGCWKNIMLATQKTGGYVSLSFTRMLLLLICCSFVFGKK